MKNFDNFTKIALECGRFGQNNCCHRLWKVAQSAKKSPNPVTLMECLNLSSISYLGTSIGISPPPYLLLHFCFFVRLSNKHFCILLFLCVLVKQYFYRINCSLQHDSNLDRQNRGRACWPPDHNHHLSPISILSFYHSITSSASFCQFKSSSLGTSWLSIFLCFPFYLSSLQSLRLWQNQASGSATVYFYNQIGKGCQIIFKYLSIYNNEKLLNNVNKTWHSKFNIWPFATMKIISIM